MWLLSNYLAGETEINLHSGRANVGVFVFVELLMLPVPIPYRSPLYFKTKEQRDNSRGIGDSG